MIKISVDESFAFDMLSILEVKNARIKDGQKNLSVRNSLTKLGQEIICSVGYTKFLQIRDSDEYRALLNANYETFDLVEAARNGPEGLAKDADAANLKRFEAKKEIQEKFFGGANTEIKS